MRSQCNSRTLIEVTTIMIDIAAAAEINPTSSMLTIITEETIVSGENRKMTAETVVMARRKKKMLMSRIAGRQTGTVIRQKVR